MSSTVVSIAVRPLHLHNMAENLKSNGDATRTELSPAYWLVESPAVTSQKQTAALIILNSPLHDYRYFRTIYDHACFRVCADGGANRLYKLLCATFDHGPESLRAAPPDLIHGDLDSLGDNVRRHYEDIGVEVSKDPDQYSTDFGKCVKKVLEIKRDVRDVLVLGSLGGRVDQGLGLLHELYREQTIRHSGVRFWLFSESSVSTVLRPGTTVINTSVAEGLITRNIGILPVYGPAVITTEGLEWDVKDWPTAMGEQVSTSNHIMTDRITITTDRDVLFTVEHGVGS